MPAVSRLLTGGLDLPPGVTFLVGEDGAGRADGPRRPRGPAGTTSAATGGVHRPPREPLLTAPPGAHVLQVDDRGPTLVDREDLALVRDRRSFLDAPERCFRDLR